MIQVQRNKYMKTTVLTATPVQLLIMLSDGAIRFCKAAIDAIKDKKYEDANHHLIRVQDIIVEFTITLDKEAPIADGLLRLYDYFVHLLIEANINKDTKPVEEVLGYLIELKETWVQAAMLAHKSASPAAVGANHG